MYYRGIYLPEVPHPGSLSVFNCVLLLRSLSPVMKQCAVSDCNQKWCEISHWRDYYFLYTCCCFIRWGQKDWGPRLGKWEIRVYIYKRLLLLNDCMDCN